MALWQKVKSLDSVALGEITSLYAVNNIPIEVRDFCSVWIEASIRHLNAEAFVSGLYSQIYEKLQSFGNSMNNSPVPFYVVRRLTDFQNYLKNNHSSSSQGIYGRFISCLDSERMVLKRSEETYAKVPQQKQSPEPIMRTGSETHTSQLVQTKTPPSSQVFNYNNPSRKQTLSMDYKKPENFLNNPVRIIIDSEMNRIFESVWNLEEANNMFAFKCHELKRHQDFQVQNRQNAGKNGTQQLEDYVQFQELESQINELKSEVLQIATVIWGKTSEVRSRTTTVIQNWTQLKTELNKDLSAWTQEQRMYANGKAMTMDINELQYLSEYLMEVAWKLRHLLQTTDKIRQSYLNLVADNNTNAGPTIIEHIATITSLIVELVQDTFVIVHQPCQVVKTNTRFHVPPDRSPLEIRLLVGEKLNLQLTPPSVSVALIDENTSRSIASNGLKPDKFNKVLKKGRLLPESARLDICPDTKCPTAIFRQISLKDFYRNGRKNTIGKEQAECVTEEKFCLLFRSEFSLGDVNFQIWKMSLPIAITTHGSQDSLAMAAVTWDNALCQLDRIPFHVQDHADWISISEMLNYKFYSMVGAFLTEENLNYFAERLSFKPGFPDSISWCELCKVNLPDRKFTFWEWFFEGAKLIEQHLKDAWKDGYIKGFIGKEVSESLLCNSGCSPGTFLFRFSESVLGGISIVWLHSDGKAYSLSPFKTKDLANWALAEKLNQETLHYVFPNIPKQDAFKKYYEEYKSASKSDDSTVDKDRYVKIRNQLVIDNPNIPKFCLAEKPSPYKPDQRKLQQLNTSDLACSNPSDPNLIEIDIEKIVDYLSSPEGTDRLSTVDYFSTSNASGFSQASPGEQEGPRSAGSRELNMYSEVEESFYMQL